MKKNIFIEYYPSQDRKRLCEIVGNEIKDIIKISYESYDEFLNDWDDYHEYQNKFSFFKYSYGCVLLRFSNELEYLFYSADEQNSVMLLCQRDAMNVNPYYVLNKEVNSEIKMIFSVKEDRDLYFNRFINRKIKKINILTKNNLNSKEEDLPSNMGIELLFENMNESLILSHHLDENKSFVFSILEGNDIKDDKQIFVKDEIE
ncbi:hypothetical protein VUJ46_01535 [Chryseobacterium sp. MYb264]|uniref:hypothetical protein n=1 Tax=Chryseobacterium sp. MYb264 TaxID=2745153 RepID=UPI002E0E23BE|nr:hypothetical protein VUJ46_01535 [Chryseobacterium sp. MYb264]